MGIKIPGNCLPWSQPSLPHCSSSPQTYLASLFSTKRRGVGGGDRSLTYHVFHQINRPPPFLLGATSAKPSRGRSSEDLRRSGRRRSKGQSLRRAFSASMDGLADDDDEEDEEEFVRRLQELALELQDCSNNIENVVPDSRNQETETTSSVSSLSSLGNGINPPWPAIRPEPPKWDEIVPASVEINANRADLPLSLLIIKKKKRWKEGVKEAGESACCSIKKAFSSMVFIVRELQRYTLRMRGVLLYENLEGIWAKVQGEMNASFVWIFQQIFSCTPTLMVYVMLLLANFTVDSISQNFAIAALCPDPPVAVEHEYQETQQNSRFDASSSKSFLVGRTASVGGGGGGGGKVKPVAGANDDGRSDGSYSSYRQKIVPADGISSAGAAMEEEERSIWHRIVEEVYRMQVSLRGETLMDSNTLHQLVSPVSAELEPEDLAVYSRTELMYHHALSQDSDNVLLLSNFAQFLFLVLHDHDRAEYYFKKAARVKPVDAEALYRYAMFLWLARKDLEGAEDAYLQAMAAADPGGNTTHYSASYAHFLWNTGGDETCYPLDGSDVC